MLAEVAANSHVSAFAYTSDEALDTHHADADRGQACTIAEPSGNASGPYCGCIAVRRAEALRTHLR
jgi:hypothetical protein